MNGASGYIWHDRIPMFDPVNDYDHESTGGDDANANWYAKIAEQIRDLESRSQSPPPESPPQ